MARWKAGMSQADVAARAKTSQAAISAFESGRRSPSVETLARVLDATGFELRRLAPPDTHERTRKIAETLLPPAELAAFTAREHRRASTKRA